MAATSSVKTAAPGLRMIIAPTTPGSSQTPYMKPCSGGKPVKAGPAAAQAWFQAQKTTPNATARTAATTMSTVRQRVERVVSFVAVVLMTGSSFGSGERNGRLLTARAVLSGGSG